VRLLLVEDEEIIRKPLVRILANAGYETLTASSGREALEVVASGAPPPALIIADVRLPGMSGIELVRNLRTAGVRLPVLLVSGAAPETREPLPGREAGPVRFLMKPFSGPELIAAIAGLLSECRPT